MKLNKSLLLKIITALIYALFIAFPFGQLTRLNFFSPQIKLYLHDLIISALIIACIFHYLANKKNYSWPVLTKSLLIFSGFAFLSLLIAIPKYQFKQIFISSLYLIRWLSYTSLYFIFSNKKIRSQLKISLENLLIYASLASAGLGIIQYLFLPDTRFLKFSGWDDHYYRLIAAFADPGFSAIIFLLGLILILNKFKKNLKNTLYIILLTIPLLLTYSRGSYLALLFALFTLSIIKKNYKIIIISLLILLISLSFLPRPGGEGVKLERVFSIFARVDNFKQGITVFQQSPIFGIGFNTMRYQKQKLGLVGQDSQTSHSASGLDSSLLLVLATTGILGFTAYLYLLKNIWQISNLTKVSLSALLIHSLFNNSLFYPWVLIWLWSISSLKENN